MTQWVERIQHWVLSQTPHHPVMVVRYEDLKQDVTKEVGKMLGFLRLNSSPENIAHKLRDDFTTFKRPHNGVSNFEHYTTSQTLHMKSFLQHAIQLAEQSNMSYILNLSEYQFP
jgi:hypothetical protein